MSRLQRLESLISAKRHALDVANAEAESARKRLAESKDSLEQWQEAQGVIQGAAQAVQTLVHTQIADVVTRCLQTVYDEDISFHVEFDRKRGKTEARLYFKMGGNEFDPVGAGSLGMCDVAAFALRVAILKLHTPPVAQVMVCDEPFRFCDKRAIERVGQLIESLAHETGIQFILVSHFAGLMTGKVIEVE